MNKKNKKSLLPIGIAISAVGAVFMTSINPGVGIGLLGVGIVFVIVSVSTSNKDESDNIAKRDENE